MLVQRELKYFEDQQVFLPVSAPSLPTYERTISWLVSRTKAYHISVDTIMTSLAEHMNTTRKQVPEIQSSLWMEWSGVTLESTPLQSLLALVQEVKEYMTTVRIPEAPPLIELYNFLPPTMRAVTT